ncbi:MULTISPECIES: ABC transporter permease [unclassified Halomonas]|uniref:ABC transporter permease n=1 Tax=unclassified Halomonas TaxID=2609666 RepID=UPI0021E3B31A|nr:MULTISPECIES: iron ABC transporter permease [unclassified Halomonas]UYG00383.1 iron ABC transporter permease [Halomonas sp. GD1P12]WNL41888.1 iron ABC transporter permease [Halomonas sp. PAMB 3264]
MVAFEIGAGGQQRRLLTALTLVIVILSLAPSARLLFEALGDLNLGSDAPLVRVLQSGATWRALGYSVYTSGLGMLIALVLGSLFAFVITLTDIRGKAVLVFCFMLPMMIPPQVTALAWLQLFGPASPLLKSLGVAPALGSPQPLYSAEGIALLLGIQAAPLVFLALRTSLLSLPRELIEAARISGARQSQVWGHIVLPVTRGALVAGASMAFISSLGNFGIPAMLGIPAGVYVLPTLIYQRMASFGTGVLPEMASLSLLIGVIALLGVALQQHFMGKSRFGLTGHSGRAHDFSLGRFKLPITALMVIVLLVILIAPLLALMISSLVPAMGVPLNATTATLAAFEEVLSRQGATWRAVSNSLWLAGGAALLLMAASLPLAYRLYRLSPRLQRLALGAVELPYALPGVVLAIACILLFVRPLPLIDVALYGTLTLIFIAYLARFLVVCLKPVAASLAQLDPSLEEAAQLAGAGPWRRMATIVLPLVAPALFAGGLLVFLLAVNELTVSALLWSAGNETLGVLIFNLEEGGESVLASAVSILVVAMVAVLMLALSLLAPRLPKGVVPWQR